MHWTLAYTTTVITACMVVQAVLTVTVRTVVSCSNNFSTKLGSGWLGYVNTEKVCGPRTTYTTYPEQRNSYGNLIKLQI